jgi:hypothetical protein
MLLLLLTPCLVVCITIDALPSSFLSPYRQAMYDADVLSEEALLSWYSGTSWLVSKEIGEQVRQAAKVFIEWLQEADSDDEE